MTSLWIVAALLFILYMGRRIRRQVAEAVGRKALERQHDQIHLEPASARPWRDATPAESATEALCENGFQDAGTYTIREMPGVVVRLLADPGASLYANVYEHPRAGSWIEIVARYQDHRGITFTTLPPTGLRPRPEHPIVHAPGLDPFALCERARAGMPEGALHPATVSRAVRDFEEGYAQAVAWRKAHGITVDEVVKVARRRAA
jgi:hypothetical protein